MARDSTGSPTVGVRGMRGTYYGGHCTPEDNPKRVSPCRERPTTSVPTTKGSLPKHSDVLVNNASGRRRNYKVI